MSDGAIDGQDGGLCALCHLEWSQCCVGKLDGLNFFKDVSDVCTTSSGESKADKMLGILPIGHLPNDETPKAALFWSLPTHGYDAWRAQELDAWKEEAIRYWPDFAPYVNQITHADTLVMARYTHVTLRSLLGDRLVHIGDAAHRTSPQLGQGANMALVNAHAPRVVLHQHHHMDYALRTYTQSRR